MTPVNRLSLLLAFAAVASSAPGREQPWVEPQDTLAAVTEPDLYAWRLFVALNWPADVVKKESDPGRKFGENAETVWESWKLASGQSDEVFLAGGADPGGWAESNPRRRDFTAMDTLPLQQLARRHAVLPVAMPAPDPAAAQRNENHMNKAAYEYVRRHELYNVEGQEAFLAKAVAARESVRQYLENGGTRPSRFQDASWQIEFPAGAKEVKAQWREIPAGEKPRYRWVETTDAGGKTRIFGLTSLHISTKDLPNWFWASFEHADNPKNGHAWELPSVDRSAGKEGFPPGLGIKGTFWENYRLRGTQVDFTDSTGQPTLLANSQIEEGFQVTSSCISCHARASIGPKLGARANRLSIFTGALPDPNNPEKGVFVGPVGAPDPGLFEAKTLASPVVGELRYIQLDFVWSLLRAQRKAH